MLDEEILFGLKGEKIKLSKINSKKFFFLIFFLIFFLLSFYFFYLQFFEKQKLLEIESKIKTISYLTFAPRGNIYDRHNNLLATSEQSFDAYVDLNKVPSSINFRDLFKDARFFYRGNQLIVRNISRETALEIMTQNLDFIKIVPSFQRKYLAGKEIGNLLGYVGFPDENEKNYHPEEFIGKSGIELTYQNYLRGKPGEIVYQITKNGLKKIKETKPIPGKNLVLTIDWEFQKRVFELMNKYFQENNYKKGAFIALDPNSGEIISLISYPSYDPEWFLNDQEKALQALNDKDLPFFNRVISGLYAPGSTIKIIHASAALEEKIVNPNTKIYAGGQIKIPHPYFPGTYSIFRDTKVYGWTDIYKAIANSVNVYFYVIGGGYPYDDPNIPIKEGLGIYRLIKYWKIFNLGEKTGIDLLGEKAGFLPSPETKKKNIFDPVWRLGDTYNVSIGQGDLLVTPLQIALFTAGVATNKIYKPFIVKKIIDENNKVIFERKPEVLKENLISEENLKVVRKGMRMTVTEGTAKILADLPIAGKSGTPEIFGKKKLNAIFTGYLFYNKPEVVMTLLIEEVPIGSVATLPLYREIVKTYLNLKYGNSF